MTNHFGWQVQRCSTDQHLEQIIALQKLNIPEAISLEELQQQGFVTVKHDLEILKAMNDAEPHAIAVSDQKVVGYVLVMLPEFAEKIPVLQPMFEEFDKIPFQGKRISDFSYFACGQACVAKEFRGQKMLDAMYQLLQKELSEKYQLCVTEIATKNPRSLRAHRRIGFQQVWQYHDGKEHWDIVVWLL